MARGLLPSPAHSKGHCQPSVAVQLGGQVSPSAQSQGCAGISLQVVRESSVQREALPRSIPRSASVGEEVRRWLGSVAAAGILGVWGSQLPAGTYSQKESSHDRGSSGQPQTEDGEKLPVHDCLSSTLLTATVTTTFPSLKIFPLPLMSGPFPPSWLHLSGIPLPPSTCFLSPSSLARNVFQFPIRSFWGSVRLFLLFPLPPVSFP